MIDPINIITLTLLFILYFRSIRNNNTQELYELKQEINAMKRQMYYLRRDVDGFR